MTPVLRASLCVLYVKTPSLSCSIFFWDWGPSGTGFRERFFFRVMTGVWWQCFSTLNWLAVSSVSELTSRFFSFFFWKIFNFKSLKVSKNKTFFLKKFVKSHDVGRVFLAQKLTGRGHESFLLFAGSAPHFG